MVTPKKDTALVKVGKAIGRALHWWAGDEKFIHRWLFGLTMLIMGLMVAKDVEFALRGPTIGDITWNDTFAVIPHWVGWFFVFESLDLFFARGWGLTIVARYAVYPVLRYALYPVLRWALVRIWGTKFIAWETRFKAAIAKEAEESKSNQAVRKESPV